jgi:hypothetical protein
LTLTDYPEKGREPPTLLAPRGRGPPPLHFASHVECPQSMALLSATVKELYSAER